MGTGVLAAITVGERSRRRARSITSHASRRRASSSSEAEAGRKRLEQHQSRIAFSRRVPAFKLAAHRRIGERCDRAPDVVGQVLVDRRERALHAVRCARLVQSATRGSSPTCGRSSTASACGSPRASPRRGTSRAPPRARHRPRPGRRRLGPNPRRRPLLRMVALLRHHGLRRTRPRADARRPLQRLPRPRRPRALPTAVLPAPPAPVLGARADLPLTPAPWVEVTAHPD